MAYVRDFANPCKALAHLVPHWVWAEVVQELVETLEIPVEIPVVAAASSSGQEVVCLVALGHVGGHVAQGQGL